MKWDQDVSRTMFRGGLALAVALVLCPGPAAALRDSYELQSEQVITNPEDQARVLLEFGELTGLAGEWITSAYVSVDLSDLVPSSDIALELYGVEDQWSVGVPTWTSPWETPGGDLEDWSSVEALLPSGRAGGEIRFDVTEIVRQQVSRENQTYGFMLVALGPDREGLLVDELIALGGSISAELNVSYRKVSGLGLRERGPGASAQKKQVGTATARPGR